MKKPKASSSSSTTINDNEDGISNPTVDQLTFAKALASPDKATRDKTINVLIKFFKKNNDVMTDIEMLKLWKALFYCYWLSDKVPIQQELAAAITSMIINIKNTSNMHLYIRSFFKTIIREWGYIDQHRINKFYTLLRFMIREIFNLMKASKWSNQMCENMTSILKEEVLNKVPNGPRYQVVDVYLEELMNVTTGDIDTNTFIKCIDPFTQAVGKATDNIYHDRVIKGIFLKFISDYATDTNDKKKEVNTHNHTRHTDTTSNTTSTSNTNTTSNTHTHTNTNTTTTTTTTTTT